MKRGIQYNLISAICICGYLLGCVGLAEPQMNLDTSVAPVTEGVWYKPALQATWHWQLLGTINTGYRTDVYDVDLFDTGSALINQLQGQGYAVICYFSAGSYEQWRTDVASIPEVAIGAALDGWADERWFDIRTTEVQALILKRLDNAVSKGCDAVEPDNVDAYANDSGFMLTQRDQLAFNRFIANAAHERGLGVGLKNDLDQITELVSYFDFAVNEQCFEYDECDLLAPFINAGKAVFNAEYAQLWVTDSNARQQLCQDAISRRFSTLILPLDLDDAFRYSCSN